MAELKRTADGWVLDLTDTSEAARVRELFGTAVLPLPLTSAIPFRDALAFARQTPMGQRHGVAIGSALIGEAL
jgi:hypothetical protein